MRFFALLLLFAVLTLPAKRDSPPQITVTTTPPNCTDTAGQHLNWFLNTFTCGNSGPVGGVIQSGAITPGHMTTWTADGQIQDAGAAPVTISGSPANGHMAMFNSTTNQIQDAGITVPLSGTTGAIGGGLLAVGASASGTATITGAVVGKNCIATPSDGTNMYALGVNIGCTVTSTNTVTVNVVAIVVLTPPSKAYNVVVLP